MSCCQSGVLLRCNCVHLVSTTFQSKMVPNNTESEKERQTEPERGGGVGEGRRIEERKIEIARKRVRER